MGQGQQHQLEDSNDAIAARATTISQQWQRCLDCKDACALTTTTPSQLGQQPQLDDCEDACASMTATTPLFRGQQRQLNDYASLTAGRGAIATRAIIAIATMAKTPVHQWQQCHCNKGNNAIVMMASIPAHQ
jgi:hypothetical protein